MKSHSFRPLPGILGLALAVFVIGLCFNPAQCNDLFWQIRAGGDVAVSGHAPRFDSYSWTRRGTPWIAHEWLCFWFLWKLYQTGGFAAIWIAEAVLVATIFTLVYIHALRETEGSPITAFLLAIAAAVVSCGFFQPRPHLWTYLFLTGALMALAHLRRSPAPWRWAWLLPMMMLFWSNVHAGVVIGVGIVFAFALGDALEARAEPTERRAELQTRALRTAMVGLACAAATLATPYGWRVYENLGATITNTTMLNIVIEWASPNFHEPDGKILMAFWGLIAYGIAFTGRKREWSPLLILILLTHEALSASRNIPLLAIAGVMLFAGDIDSSLKKHLAGAAGKEPSLFGRNPTAISVLGVAVTIVASAALHMASVLQSDDRTGAPLAARVATECFQLKMFPSAACRFIEREQFPTSIHIYNIYDIGGYLIWRLPQYPVFIDGRSDIYFGRNLDDEGKLYGLPYDWDKILTRYGADVIFTTASQNQTRLYLAAPDWALVYADRPNLAPEKIDASKINALIFVKRLPKYAALIARCRQDCPATAQIRAETYGRGYMSLQ